MRYTKHCLLVLLSVLFVCTVAGCAGGGDEGPKANIAVTIQSTDGILLEDTVALSKNQCTADQAIQTACQAVKLAYTFQNGMFDNFGGIASTQTDGWLLYVNDTLAEVGAKDVALQDGDRVAFRYENYDTAFAQ